MKAEQMATKYDSALVQAQKKAEAYRRLVLAAIKELAHQGMHAKLRAELAARIQEIDAK